MPDKPFTTSPNVNRRTLLIGAAALMAQPAPIMAAAVQENRKSTQLIPLSSGIAIEVEDSGTNRPAVILLHAATGSIRSWAPQRAALEQAGYRVIAYNRRGYGRSDAGPADQRGSAAGDLRDLVDALKIDRFHLVGTAAGGFVVPDFALAFPSRLFSMTIACSLGGVTEPEFTAQTSALLPPGFRDLPPEFRELGPQYRASDPDGVKRWLAVEHDAITAPAPIRQTPLNTLNWAAFARIRTPALLIAGGADFYMPPFRMQVLASHIAGSRFLSIADAGHAASWEQPEVFNAGLIDFLKKHS